MSAPHDRICPTPQTPSRSRRFGASVGRRNHLCPGGCGQPVPNKYFSCGEDWRRLPRILQRALLDTADRPLGDPARQRAWTEATQFLMAGGES
ncbi:hypothetical protein [Nocardia wallacei]|uniref:hypothetical protein n=1 Tax=Nocardia wallacei TaxID=480035 RepID=UPI002458A78D|nr:hypothetical protein [Nocardia wallacei]